MSFLVLLLGTGFNVRHESVMHIEILRVIGKSISMGAIF